MEPPVIAVDDQAIHVRGVPQRTAKLVTINDAAQHDDVAA